MPELPEIVYESGRLSNTSLFNDDEPEKAEGAVEDDLNCLKYLHSSLFGTILEDIITQLRILAECNNELRIIKAKSDWDHLKRVKYGVKHVVADELDGIDPKDLHRTEYKIKKLDTDRTYVTDVITECYVDLCLHANFKPLVDNINTIIQKEAYQAGLIEEEAKNRILRRDLNRQLRQQRNHIKTVRYDTEAKIEQLKTDVEDSTLMAETRNRYVDNWQVARSEQHVETIHISEIVFTESIEYYKRRADHEQRVHLEVEMLVNLVISETLEKVEFWMEKYDKDMEEIDLKIQIKKNMFQDMQDRRRGLEEVIAIHGKQIEAWLKFKLDRENARKYRELMTKSAITVQAWWRGLLVRRMLGPFKPTKKPRAPKKK